MKRFLLALMMCLGLSMLSVSSASAAVTCPPGTTHANQSKPTYAECNVDSTATANDLMKTVQNVLTVIFGLLGVVAVVVVIYGGFTFMTSQGDAGKVMKGRNTILWGLVGIVVSVAAFIIVNFVLDGVFNGTAAGGNNTNNNTYPGNQIEVDPNNSQNNNTYPGNSIQPNPNNNNNNNTYPGNNIQPNSNNSNNNTYPGNNIYL